MKPQDQHQNLLERLSIARRESEKAAQLLKVEREKALQLQYSFTSLTEISKLNNVLRDLDIGCTDIKDFL